MGFRLHHRHCATAFLIGLGFAAVAWAADPTFSARVISILDGDTIEVLQESRPLRIRLQGIDAPERNQPFGTRSREYLGSLVFRKTVRVIPTGRDRYNRLLANIECDGASVNQQMVRAGFAWWFRQYAPAATRLRLLEEEARDSGRGLWSDPHPLPPWEFRRRERTSGQ